MKRREFIVILVGVLIASPFRTSARQPERMRRIGMLMNLTAADPEAQTRITRVTGIGLGPRSEPAGRLPLGWRRPRLSPRCELAATSPDLILASTVPALAAAQQVTCTAPIAFVNMINPVGGG